MKIVQKEIELSRLDYYRLHLSLVNCFLPKKLTNKEIDILSEFMCLDIDDNERFNTSSRREVIDRLGKTLKTNISNYLSSMLRKGVLVKENGIFNISMFIFPDKVSQGYQFKIINNG